MSFQIMRDMRRLDSVRDSVSKQTVENNKSESLKSVSGSVCLYRMTQTHMYTHVHVYYTYTSFPEWF